ncbi:MAG: alpha-glucosidase [Sporolactobacillus sp.]
MQLEKTSGTNRMNLSVDWWKKAIIYQVYPRSFQDSDGDGIGDLQGIIERLPYLRELGVDVIWLNPIYASPNVDGGYDISDYEAINSDFGTMSDFDALLEKAHDYGLKIMMDLVVNHTSDEHRWFTESRSSKTNSKRDFYIWRDPVDGHEPNNWGSYFNGSAWTYDSKTGQYYLHLFAEKQPDLNWENPKLRQAVYQMMNFWVEKGVDGFRMDVINLISKQEGLPQAPQSAGERYGNVEARVANGPHVHDYIREMNHYVLHDKKLITVGETPGAQPEDATFYAGKNGEELNMVFQFEHMELDNNAKPLLGKWSDRRTSLRDLRQCLSKWQTSLNGKAWNSLYWNNHDRPRVVSRFGNDSPRYRVVSAKMLATLLHFMQGTPYIYQGEEIGMTNAAFQNLSDYRDIETLNAYHYLVDTLHEVDPETMMTYLRHTSRDNARTPMQWSDEENAGFTHGKSWLMTNPNYQQINTAQALADPNSIFYYYKKLINLRHKLPIITDGVYALWDGNADDDQVYAYTRKTAVQTLFVALNFTDTLQQRHYSIPQDAQLLISNYDANQRGYFRPYEAKVYLYENKEGA